MLKTKWTIERCGTYADKNTLWHFTSSEDDSTSLYLRAVDEDKAWNKLGNLLHKDGKEAWEELGKLLDKEEDTSTKTFEGKIILRDMYDLIFFDNYRPSIPTLHEMLIHGGIGEVEVEVRVKSLKGE